MDDDRLIPRPAETDCQAPALVAPLKRLRVAALFKTFRFCFKLPREISHERSLAAQVEATRAFVERRAGLGERLEPFFLQLPQGYTPQQLAVWPRSTHSAIPLKDNDRDLARRLLLVLGEKWHQDCLRIE